MPTDSLPLSATLPPSDPGEVADWLDAQAEAFAAKVVAAFRRAWTAAIGAFTADAEAAALIAGAADTAAEWAMASWMNDLTTLAPTVAGMYESGALAAWVGQKNPGVIHPDLWTPVVHQEAVAHVRQATNRLVGVGQSSWRSIRNLIGDNMAAGTDATKIAETLREHRRMTEARAETIARTEVVGAHAAGTRAGAEALGKYGPVEHVWIATNDVRTRPSHAEADNQVRLFSQPFTVGGLGMMRPHDPAAPASEIVNCRCVEVFLYEGDTRPDGTKVGGSDAEKAEAVAPPTRPSSPLVEVTDPTPFHKVGYKHDDKQVWLQHNIEAPDEAALAPMKHAVCTRLPNGTLVVREVSDAQVKAMRASDNPFAAWRPGGAEHDELWQLVQDNDPFDGPSPVRRLFLSEQPNPQDAYWAKTYRRPQFKSVASAGKGNLTVYGPQPKLRPGTYRHEVGHLVEEAQWEQRPWGPKASGRASWKGAMARDAKKSAKFDLRQFDVELSGEGHHLLLGDVRGISTYGAAARAEDFAEAFRLWSYDRKHGGIGWKSDGSPLRFADVFPGRAKLLDEAAETATGYRGRSLRPPGSRGTLDDMLALPDVAPSVRRDVFEGAGRRVSDDGTATVVKNKGKKTVSSEVDAAAYGRAVPRKRGSAPADWYASNEDWFEAQATARRKAAKVPQPTAEDIARNERAIAKSKEGGRAGGELRGSAPVRRERGEALFDEFGGTERGWVPCVYCGLKISPQGRGGYALMTQDKILTLVEGGHYGTAREFPNLLPSCHGCNVSRGEAPYPVRPRWEKTKKKK